MTDIEHTIEVLWIRLDEPVAGETSDRAPTVRDLQQTQMHSEYAPQPHNSHATDTYHESMEVRARVVAADIARRPTALVRDVLREQRAQRIGL